MRLGLSLHYSGATLSIDRERILYLAGRKDEAATSVPDALVDEVALCGPRERIRDRLSEWTSSGVTTMLVTGDQRALRLMAELVHEHARGPFIMTLRVRTPRAPLGS